jgi:hypothetical protein
MQGSPDDGRCNLLELALISSTEVVDAHWNDAVAFFMWYR